MKPTSAELLFVNKTLTWNFMKICDTRDFMKVCDIVADTRSWTEGHDDHIRHMFVLHKEHLTTVII